MIWFFRTMRKQIYFQNLKCLNKLLFFCFLFLHLLTLCFLACFGYLVVFPILQGVLLLLTIALIQASFFNPFMVTHITNKHKVVFTQ